MAISFSQIPINLRTPGAYVEFDSSRALKGTPAKPHRALLIGHRLSTGSVAEAVLTAVPSVSAAHTYFGRGSMLAGMVEAFKNANAFTELFAVALDAESGGAAATGSFAITGTATAAGALVCYVGGRRFEVAVAVGDTADAVGSALAAAINADNDLPATAANVTGTVTVTARHKGTQGNKIDLRKNYYDGELVPAGLACTVTAMASGATDPDADDAITAIGDEQFDTIALGFNDTTNFGKITDELEARWDGTVQKEGHAFIAVGGNQGTLTSAGNAENSPWGTLFGIGLSPTPPWEVASTVAALDANRCETDPFQQRRGMKIIGMLPPAPSARFTRVERNILLTDGVSTFTVDQAGDCYIERLITTYQTKNSLPDTTYLDISTVRGLAQLRFDVRAKISLRFPDYKLGDDGGNYSPGAKVATPGDIRTALLSLFLDWEAKGWVQDYDSFQEGLIVERNVDDPNRVDALIPPDLINNFMIFAGQLQFIL